MVVLWYASSLLYHLVIFTVCPCSLQPAEVQPTTLATPQSAYGTSKLISELLINEYTRRGLVDGRILRLPTVIVRPGPPAPATSAFLSGTSMDISPLLNAYIALQQ